MARDTNLSPDEQPDHPPASDSSAGTGLLRESRGVRTHVLLVVAMALVIAVVSGLSLLLIRHHLRDQVTNDLSRDLHRSVVAFQDLQAERLRTLERENELISQLPTLKALMTSGDDLTIQNEAAEFWRLSGADIFVLIDPSGRVVAGFTRNSVIDPALRQGMRLLLASSDTHYLIDGGSLYACSLRPLYFGSDQDGTLLGYVVSGISIERTVRAISQPAGAEAAFLSGGRVLASTLSLGDQASLARQASSLSGTSQAPGVVILGNTHFLYEREDFSAAATAPVLLVVMTSFEPAERSINDINRMVLIVGLLALVSGTALMIVVSRLVTRPLEELSKSLHAFGLGNVEHKVPRHGTQEVRNFSAAFSRMRDEIQRANQAVLESERLATIGRMASSVSHDLRHYLSAIYANAEFLMSDRFTPKERGEIFAEIRTAVGGTTEMLESLLIFSRTGASIRRQPELMANLVERAVALARAHPDAEGVTLAASLGEPSDSAANVDCNQIQRAICNLLLNACQSARSIGAQASIAVTLESQDRHILVNVIDNGPGVPHKIRKSLFEPFVSEGKQKGTGLGLTLAHRIALEHGGKVVLLSSRPGETIFQLKVARALSMQGGAAASACGSQEQVTSDENVRP
jgi:signal transduction histidine kinase